MFLIFKKSTKWKEEEKVQCRDQHPSYFYDIFNMSNDD